MTIKPGTQEDEIADEVGSESSLFNIRVGTVTKVSRKGNVIGVKVEADDICVGNWIGLTPEGATEEFVQRITSIKMLNEPVEFALSGENVTILLVDCPFLVLLGTVVYRRTDPALSE